MGMKYLSILFLLTFAAENFGQSQKDTTKKKYNIFHATPKRLMRDFATDRPDATESSYTVDAGHFQVETDLLKRNVLNPGM